jgi:hypothetical protein
MEKISQLSMVDFCEAKANGSFETDTKRRRIEMAALLTVIRENIVESGKTNFKTEELIDQSIDLTEPLLWDSYFHETFKGPPIGSSIWSLIIFGDLRIERDSSLTCSENLKRSLLYTLPGELQNQL